MNRQTANSMAGTQESLGPGTRDTVEGVLKNGIRADEAGVVIFHRSLRMVVISQQNLVPRLGDTQAR